MNAKTFRCILVRNFHRYETDSWKLISPTGKSYSVWAHKSIDSTDEYAVDVLNEFQHVCHQWHSGEPTGGSYCAPNHWMNGRYVQLTREQMLAFRDFCNLPSNN